MKIVKLANKSTCISIMKISKESTQWSCCGNSKFCYLLIYNENVDIFSFIRLQKKSFYATENIPNKLSIIINKMQKKKKKKKCKY